MAIFVAQVKGATAMGRTDINRVSETVLIPLLSEVFGYQALKNLNYTEEENYPGIDLGDEQARVAFQVTSTASIEKVRETLIKFVRYRLYEKYDQLFMYILTEKQKSYSDKGLSEILEGKCSFDVSRQILDYQDILRAISGFQIEKALSACSILERNLSYTPHLLEHITNQTYEPLEGGTETVYLNLVEVSFPDILYIGNLPSLPTKKQEKNRRWKGLKPKSQRDAVREKLLELGLRFGTDWETFGKRIITFHNLSNDAIPLAQVVLPESVSATSTLDFYSVDEDHDRVFKSLLRRCLQQKLYHRGIQWQNDKNLFIFVSKDGEDHREEHWVGSKSSERVVFERTRKTKKPDETWYCKHLAFASRFYCIDHQWFMAVKPDWFFSRDGYSESFYAAQKVNWLKKRENNEHLYNQFRFICYFVTHDDIPNLFEKDRRYPYLSFGNAVAFQSYPELNDDVWNPPKSDGEDEDLDDAVSQMSLFDL